MRDCKTAAVQTLAQQWVNFMVAVRGVPALDQTRLAKTELRTAIESIKTTESSVRSELSSIAAQVRRVDPQRAKVTLAGQLKRSRYLRQQMSVLENKRASLQQHLDTLDTSELNQQVISSVKKTSSALKSLGLEAEQQHLDALFVDMEDRLHDMKTIQQSLSSPLDDSDYDMMALDQELDMLLNADDNEFIAQNVKQLDVKKQVEVIAPKTEPKTEPILTTTAPEPILESQTVCSKINCKENEKEKVAEQNMQKDTETEATPDTQASRSSTKSTHKKGVRQSKMLESIVEA